jgi:hypothetical protein
MSRKLHSPEQVQEMITKYQAGASLTQLGREYGGSHRTILNVLVRNDVPRRPPGRIAWRDFTPEQQAEIITRWETGESQSRIAKELGTAQTVISKFLSFNGIEPVSRYGKLKGEDHPSWRGGTFVNGYRMVKIRHDDQMACMRNTGGYVMEHRLVMARELHRPLTAYETVHHKNGDRADNRIENLQLRHGQHGNGVVPMCLDCGSHNIGHAEL